MIKRPLAIVSAALLILSTSPCGDSTKGTADSVRGGSPATSDSSLPVDTPDSEVIPGFSEKLAAFEELHNKYWEEHERIISGNWSSDTHTEEGKKEYKRKRTEILSPYPAEKLKAAIEEQCRYVRDNEPYKYMGCLDKKCRHRVQRGVTIPALHIFFIIL